DEGNAERLEPLRQHLVAAFGGLAGAEEVADHDALRAFERSGLEKLGAQGVEAIRRLGQVCEEHDAAVEAGLQRCAAPACEDREAPLVVAREIALVSLEDALAEPRLETDVLQRADAALEAFLVERAGGRDYRDSVAGSERGRTRHAAMLARPSGTCTQGKRLAG